MKEALSNKAIAMDLTNEEYMGRKEIAHYLKITLPTLTEWVKRAYLSISEDEEYYF